MNEENNNNVGNSPILKPPTENKVEPVVEPVFATEPAEPIVEGNDLMAPAPPIEEPTENKFVGGFSDESSIEPSSDNQFVVPPSDGLIGDTYSDSNANITLEQIRSETEEKKLSTSSLQTKVKKKKKGWVAIIYVVIIFAVAIGALLFFYLNSNEPLEPGLPQGTTPGIDIFPEE